MMRGGSLGVHTMHCFDTTLRRVRLLCRMTRAQALPASSWLFPPRYESEHREGETEGEGGVGAVLLSFCCKVLFPYYHPYLCAW